MFLSFLIIAFVAYGKIEPIDHTSSRFVTNPPNGKTVSTFLQSLFSDTFSCFYDSNAEHKAWADVFYNGDNAEGFYCCGIMANGREQCDRMQNWYIVDDKHASLCEKTPEEAYNTGNTANPKFRRDLCCENDIFEDCGRCPNGFMVWDWTVHDTQGGDVTLEQKLAAEDQVTLDKNWEETFKDQFLDGKMYCANGQVPVTPEEKDACIPYPKYAYDNDVYPAGFAFATLRQYNNPPVCVYAPNMAGHVIEIKVEPVQPNNRLCVDDLLQDLTGGYNPGMGETCDNVNLQYCYNDADTDTALHNGFGIYISCAESCADSDVDMWIRLRSSIAKWSDAGDESKLTDRAELNTEMWCAWGKGNMTGNFDFSNIDSDQIDFPTSLTGDFQKWNVWPSDLVPLRAPKVEPLRDAAGFVSTILALVVAVFLFV